MPPRIGGVAPKCAKCDKSVYAAEQVIGPASKIYHKPCLACTICGRRLDSSLLVDHEGQPMCTNCYKAHLGQGKGGFSTSVPLRPAIKATLDSAYTRSPPKTAFGGKASTAPSGTPLCARCAKPVCEYALSFCALASIVQASFVARFCRTKAGGQPEVASRLLAL